jgi:hypothetical protein
LISKPLVFELMKRNAEVVYPMKLSSYPSDFTHHADMMKRSTGA